MSKRIWLLLDGNNYVHRDYHAAGIEKVGPLLSMRIDAMVGEWRPERVMVAFDSGETFRNQIDPEYKAGRTKPDDIDQAIDDAKEACIDHSADVLAVDGFEADDIIATWVRMAAESEAHAVIASSDKDLHQLIQDKVVCQLTKCQRDRGKLYPEWMNAERLRERFGVDPWQWVEYRMLVGDTSDNIKGIEGFGDKTAAKLLQRCGTLDRFFDAPFSSGITERLKNRLLGSRERLDALRELFTLKKNVPMPEHW